MGHRQKRRAGRAAALAAAAMATVCLAALLSACGAGAGAGAGGAQSTPTPPASTAGGLTVHSTPAQILAASAKAFGHLSSYRVNETAIGTRGEQTSVVMGVAIPGRMEMISQDGDAAAEIRLIGPVAYMRGNVAYWVARGEQASAVRLLSNRWVRLSSSAPGMAALRDLTLRSTVGRCMMQTDFATLTVAPHTAKVGGVQAIVLIDHGDRPGDTPSRLYISATGPALPLLQAQTGPETPGTTRNAGCAQTDGGTGGGDTNEKITFDGYNTPLRVKTPRGAITAPTLRAGLKSAAPRPAPASAGQRAAERTQASELLGTWAASGRVVRTYRTPGDSVGETFARVWVIQRKCGQSGCPLYITRTAIGGPLTAQLVWARGHWSATFVSTNYCGPRLVAEYDYWTFVVHRGWVGASDVDRVAHCSGAHNSAIWTARQTAKPIPTTART